MTDKSRRRFLQLLSTGAVTSLAGCSTLFDKPNGANTDNPEEMTPPGPQGNQTNTLEPIEPPPGGYVDKNTGEIKWDAIDRDAEYAFAAEDAYRAHLDLLTYTFDLLRRIYSFVKADDPPLERLQTRLDTAKRASDQALVMTDKTMELLTEIKQTDANKVVLKQQEVIKNIQNHLGKVEELLTKYQNNQMEYVYANYSTYYQEYRELKGNIYLWSAVAAEIDNKYFDPTYKPTENGTKTE